MQYTLPSVVDTNLNGNKVQWGLNTHSAHTSNNITTEVTYVPLLSCCFHSVNFSWLNTLMSWSTDPWRCRVEYINRCKHQGYDSKMDNKLNKTDYHLILCVPLHRKERQSARRHCEEEADQEYQLFFISIYVHRWLKANMIHNADIRNCLCQKKEHYIYYDN